MPYQPHPNMVGLFYRQKYSFCRRLKRKKSDKSDTIKKSKVGFSDCLVQKEKGFWEMANCSQKSTFKYQCVYQTKKSYSFKTL